MMRIVFAMRYVLIFFKALVLANLEVARLVLSPTMPIQPGFLAIPLDAVTDFEITALANSITLTPGTISVHVSPDRETLVIHVLNIGDDADRIRYDVKNILEKNILKFTRPHDPSGGRS